MEGLKVESQRHQVQLRVQAQRECDASTKLQALCRCCSLRFGFRSRLYAYLAGHDRQRLELADALMRRHARRAGAGAAAAGGGGRPAMAPSPIQTLLPNVIGLVRPMAAVRS